MVLTDNGSDTCMFLSGTPRGISYNDVRESLLRIDGVKEVHNLRIWALTMDKTAVSAHVALGRWLTKYNLSMYVVVTYGVRGMQAN